ncbi:hypothetical protein RB653_002202 [Dictyostelium firmibasis]|uniref:Small-subunit processome Utp12 domain-containing protein n=1 Tax=Dictyostelium firmibasis TaxID=79012 RepID=A0AAN7YPU6_9MYCE
MTSVTTYDKDRELFARVGKENKIEVFNSFNGKLLHSFVEFEETKNEFILLSFSTHDKSENKEYLKNLVAVSSSGLVYMYDCIDFKKKGIFHTNSKNITSVVLGKRYLFTSDSSGKILQWDIKTKQISRSFNSSEKSISSMGLNNSESQLVLANNDITLIDLANFKESKRVATGSNSIKQIQFTQDDKYIVCNKYQSTIQIYNIENLNNNNESTYTLNATGPTKSISVLTHEIKRGSKTITQYLIASLLQTSQVNVWAYYQDDQYNKEADTPITEINSKSNQIFSMNFHSTSELVLSFFEKEKYHFERVKFFDKKIFIKSITVERPSEFENVSNNKKQKTSETISIQGNAAEMKQDKVKLPTIKKSTDSIASAGTIVDLIAQSLKADNDSLLLSSIKVNFSVIQGTVKALPSPYAYSLLSKLLKYLATDNSKSLIVLPWVNCIIKDHSSYLLSVPNLSKKLSILNTIIQDKFELHNRLSKLVGKFELIASQTKGDKTESIDYEPSLVYDEASDNEQQDADGDMVEEDDEDDESDEFDGMEGDEDDEDDEDLDDDIADLMDDDE